MPIVFSCWNPDCKATMTMLDAAAGKRLKCPVCFTPVLVPEVSPATLGRPQARKAYRDKQITDTTLTAQPEAAKGHGDTKPLPAASGVGSQDQTKFKQPELDDSSALASASATKGKAVSFGAIEIGARLFGKKPGTWILALIVMGLASGGWQILVNLIGMPLAMASAAVVGTAVLPLLFLILALLGLAVQGLLTGGMFRMALKQIDGKEIQLGDLFNVRDVAGPLALAILLLGLLSSVGFALFFLPGLVVLGLTMFTLPLIADAGLDPVTALRMSLAALQRDWFSAAVFVFAMAFLVFAGALPCFLGLLFTVPLSFLTITALYRRAFAPGGKPRLAIVEDPQADWPADDLLARRTPKAPLWAWLLMGTGMAAPVCAAVLLLLGGQSLLQRAGDLYRPSRKAAGKGAGLALGPGARGSGPAGGADLDAAFGGMMKKAGGEDMQAEMQKAFAAMAEEQAKALAKTGGKNAPRVEPSAAVPEAGEITTSAQALEALAAESPETRTLGLTWLGQHPGGTDPNKEQVSQALVTLLSGEPAPKGPVAKAMEGWATATSVPALSEAIESDQPEVRRSMIRALGRLKDNQGLPALASRLVDKTDRSEASRMLTYWGPSCADEVGKYTTHADPAVRNEAAAILRRLNVAGATSGQASGARKTRAATDSDQSSTVRRPPRVPGTHSPQSRGRNGPAR